MVDTPTGARAISVRGLAYSFGGVIAVDRVDWIVSAGTVVGLIGPNGAGKTTFLNLIGGFLRAQQGRIWVGARETTGWPAHRVAQLGVIRTFQVARDFDHLTVLENMLVAPQRQPGEKLANALVFRSRGRAFDKRQLQRAATMLDLFGIYETRDSYASELSGGQRRLLELARAMMADPKVLLLDEPTAGVNLVLIKRLVEHFARLRAEGITLVVVEHNLAVVEEISDSVTVMANGALLATGTMASVRADPAVQRAYLTGGVSSNVAS